MSSEMIKLQVGEHQFSVAKQTLLGSHYFVALFRGPWADADLDLPCFVDQDGEVFKHVLTFLRSSTFPLLFDPVKCHDHIMYLKIEEQAKFFQVDALAAWLKKKEYEGAARVHYYGKIQALATDQMHVDLGPHDCVAFEVDWRLKKTYLCPRGIPVHKGASWKCGRQCEKAANHEDGDDYEEEYMPYVSVARREVYVDHTRLLHQWESSSTDP